MVFLPMDLRTNTLLPFLPPPPPPPLLLLLLPAGMAPDVGSMLLAAKS
jgi:hypothetical protein